MSPAWVGHGVTLWGSGQVCVHKQEGFCGEDANQPQQEEELGAGETRGPPQASDWNRV